MAHQGKTPCSMDTVHVMQSLDMQAGSMQVSKICAWDTDMYHSCASNTDECEALGGSELLLACALFTC